jgi:hypothetical protein
MTLSYTFFNNQFSAISNDIIEKDFKKKEIMLIKEELSHDGYDSEGPKSDLYDLWVLTKTKDDYIIYYYHFENWFYGEEKKYDLDKTYKLSKVRDCKSLEYIKFLEFAKLTNSKNIMIELELIN